MSENDISNVYVKLGNDFNVACAAFGREEISMRYATLLSSVPLTIQESGLIVATTVTCFIFRPTCDLV